MQDQTSIKMNGTGDRQLHSLLKGILFILGLAALFASWWLLSMYLAAWTEAILAPWDVDKRALPNVGTLPRIVNDFFEGPGWWVPAGLTVSLSAICAFLRLLQTRFRQVSVPWELAATNIIFGLLSFFIVYPLAALDNLWRQHLSLPDVPHFYSLYMTLFLLLWLIYLLVQKQTWHFSHAPADES